MPVIGDDFIKNNSEYNKIILQLLFNRGLSGQPDIERFFKPDKNNLYDPFLFKDMAAAVALVINHLKAGNLIVIYGDYDADGVTAVAALVEVLNILKAKTVVYIPARTSEGYGLNKKAIDELGQSGAKLIITVDNGIRNKNEVNYAKAAGLDVIITDHHEVPVNRSDWPDCLILNPKADSYPFKYLAGVGVAFKLAQALILSSRLDDKLKVRLEEKILDLVAIGTVADMMSLKNENRILVHEGLKVLNRGKRLGIKELIKVAQINGGQAIKAFNIGWQIAPRLNSAGRLDHANTAYELLIIRDQAEAEAIARKLNEKNSARQKLTEEIFSQAKKLVEPNLPDDKILIAVAPGVLTDNCEVWPEGVMGLVAGRLCEAYSRPALVITKFSRQIKGSGRSIDEFNLMAAIEQASEYLERFGGHAAACGFTLKSQEDLNGFADKIKRLANEALASVELKPKILIEAEIDLTDISDELLEDLEKFEPFGEDNERPKFLSRGLGIRDKVSMGANGQHVKFRFGSIWAVAFGQAENFKDFKIGDKVDAVFYLEFNEFNGRRAAQMKIVDIKKVSV